MKKWKLMAFVVLAAVMLIANSVSAMSGGGINRSHVYVQWIHYHYHDNLSALIETDNFGTTQQVTVYYRINKGTWNSVIAGNKQLIANNREAWTMNVPLSLDKPVIDVFVKYTVDGNAYYDDNNGAYYTTGSVDSTAPSWVFGQADVALVGANYEEHFYDGTEWFNGSIETKHFNDNQTVKVIYTLDNWANQSVIQPSFLRNEANSTNLQKWVFYKQLIPYNPLNYPALIQFKVEYSFQFYFNGMPMTFTYVDDNYGKYYKVSHLGQINNWSPNYDMYD
ncbi:MAG: hypothetical protein JWM44_513 [Bacilli bacterium]|nr:hypothetical protein [Bacilli bacterium]